MQRFDSTILSALAVNAMVLEPINAPNARLPTLSTRTPLTPLEHGASVFQSQYLRKEHARFSIAKTDQTVSEFNPVRQFRDAPFAYHVGKLASCYRFDSSSRCVGGHAILILETLAPNVTFFNDYKTWDIG